MNVSSYVSHTTGFFVYLLYKSGVPLMLDHLYVPILTRLTCRNSLRTHDSD